MDGFESTESSRLTLLSGGSPHDRPLEPRSKRVAGHALDGPGGGTARETPVEAERVRERDQFDVHGTCPQVQATYTPVQPARRLAMAKPPRMFLT
jgi:hypothetical protein